MFKQAIICAILILIAQSHATFYPITERNITCIEPKPAKIYSWHIHLLFFQLNPGNQAGAIEVRERFIQEFKDVLVEKECPNLTHNAFNCMFEVDWEPAGPFPTAQWAVYLLPDQFTKMVTWIVQNRNDYDIMIHPNTGCAMEDHSNWAIFGGHSWELNMGAFGADAPFDTPPYLQDKESLKKHQEEAIKKSSFLKNYFKNMEN